MSIPRFDSASGTPGQHFELLQHLSSLSAKTRLPHFVSFFHAGDRWPIALQSCCRASRIHAVPTEPTARHPVKPEQGGCDI